MIEWGYGEQFQLGTYKYYILYGVCLVATTQFFIYVHSVITEICDALNIKCFSIKEKK